MTHEAPRREAPMVPWQAEPSAEGGRVGLRSLKALNKAEPRSRTVSIKFTESEYQDAVRAVAALRAEGIATTVSSLIHAVSVPGIRGVIEETRALGS